eukprot:Selendium_serpulae@DN6383_c0_g1_i3.p1
MLAATSSDDAALVFENKQFQPTEEIVDLEEPPTTFRKRAASFVGSMLKSGTPPCKTVVWKSVDGLTATDAKCTIGGHLVAYTGKGDGCRLHVLRQDGIYLSTPVGPKGDENATVEEMFFSTRSSFRMNDVMRFLKPEDDCPSPD